MLVLVLLLIFKVLVCNGIDRLAGRLTCLRSAAGVVLSSIKKVRSDVRGALRRRTDVIRSCSVRMGSVSFTHRRCGIRISIVPGRCASGAAVDVCFKAARYPLGTSNCVFGKGVALPLGGAFGKGIAFLLTGKGGGAARIIRSFSNIDKGFSRILSKALSKAPTLGSKGLSLGKGYACALSGITVCRFGDFRVTTSLSKRRV